MGRRTSGWIQIRVLGTGGFGKVYLGQNFDNNERVAIKRILEQEGEAAAQGLRFLKADLEALLKIEHPNIPKLKHFGLQPETFLVMEYVPDSVHLGKEVKRRIRDRQPFTTTELRNLVEQLASALAAAHHAKFVHRDVKPENILIHFDADGNLLAKLIDFGIARTASHSQPQSQAIGSYLYMAPEQTLTDERITVAVDWYALTVVAAELLLGVALFDGAQADVLEQKRNPGFDVLVSIRQRLPDFPSNLPKRVEKFIQCGMAYRADLRPKTKEEFCALFGAALDAIDQGRTRLPIAGSWSHMIRGADRQRYLDYEAYMRTIERLELQKPELEKQLVDIDQHTAFLADKKSAVQSKLSEIDSEIKQRSEALKHHFDSRPVVVDINVPVRPADPTWPSTAPDFAVPVSSQVISNPTQPPRRFHPAVWWTVTGALVVVGAVLAWKTWPVSTTSDDGIPPRPDVVSGPEDVVLADTTVESDAPVLPPQPDEDVRIVHAEPDVVNIGSETDSGSTAPPERPAWIPPEGMTLIVTQRTEFPLGGDVLKGHLPKEKYFLDPFAIDNDEVTIGVFCEQWSKTKYEPTPQEAECLKKIGSPKNECPWSVWDDDKSVPCVAFVTAETYCEVTGKRLPTELEWEATARGLSEAKFASDNRTEPCPDDAKSSKTHCDFEGSKEKFPNPWRCDETSRGIRGLDWGMSEWVKTDPGRVKTAPGGTVRHQQRGGHWQLDCSTPVSSLERNFTAGPNEAESYVGLRCAANTPKSDGGAPQ